MEEKITGNKGEWSEIYTLSKLLGDGRVYAGDADMNKMNLYYPILNVIRREAKKYEYEPKTDKRIIIIKEDGQKIAEIPVQRFVDEAKNLLTEIKTAKGDGAYEIPSAEAFMQEVKCTKLKAPSKDKADIHIVIHDTCTGMTPELGFSIKSQLGSASTLLNAGMTTNVRFRIRGIQDAQVIENINAISAHRDRMAAIYENNGSLKYDSIKNETFRNNLMFIDCCLPLFVGECLRLQNTPEAETSVKVIVEQVAEENPFHYEGANRSAFYEHKMKKLLIASALGMTPTTAWNGRYDANGGYLVVRKDGEIVCYHFYNMNDVEDYLYNNTRFECASRSRYNFGYLYMENDKCYIDLNLQIRFKK